MQLNPAEIDDFVIQSSMKRIIPLILLIGSFAIQIQVEAEDNMLSRDGDLQVFLAYDDRQKCLRYVSRFHETGTLNPTNGKLESKIHSKSNKFHFAIACEKHGRFFATASGKLRVKSWNFADGSNLFQLVPETHIWHLEISAREPHLLGVAGNDGYLAYVELKSAKLVVISRSDKLKPNMCSIAISSDSKLIAAGNADGQVMVWERSTGRQLHQTSSLGHGNPSLVQSLIFSSNDDFVVAGLSDGTVHEIAAQTWKKKRIGSYDSSVESLALSPDNHLLAVGLWDGTIPLWDRRTDVHIARLSDKANPDALVGSMVFNPKGSVLYTGSVDGSIRGWDLQTKKLLWRIKLE